MRANILKDIRCPVCKGPLSLDETALPIISVETECGQEINETFLLCSKCLNAYPVIAGVAILVQNPLTYVASNYSTIVSVASGYISTAMINYLHWHALDLVGDEKASTGSGSPRAMSRYISAHYENITSILPVEHPLRRLVGEDYGNWYERLLQFAQPYLTSRGQALDLGCSVGGFTYRLARFNQFVYGLDYSFCAVLTARRVLLAQPDPQTSYRLHFEGAYYQERPLAVERSDNVELIVASADCLPFSAESFDTVTCPNLIDVMPDPDGLLDSVFSALHGGGIFIESDPYEWDTARSPLERWFGARPGEASAEATRTAIRKRFSLLAEQDMVPWVLREYERFFKLYFNHHLIARKDSVSAR